MFALAHVPTTPRRAGRLAALAVGLAALLGVASPASASVSFGTTSSYNVGSGAFPLGVAVGDLNEDGNLDIITANAAGTTSLMLGDGAGGFSLASGWPKAAGGGAQSLVIDDFNEDGHLDVATANRSGDTVAIQLGDGAGGLLSISTYSVGLGDPQPFFIAKGDFNDDGHTDLVTANQNTGNVSLLLGDGNGAFSPAPGSPFAAGAAPRGVAVGDVNGDHEADVIVSNESSDNETVLLGDGAGGLTEATGSPHTVGDAPREVALGDFNSDGNLDIATANSGEPTVGNNTVSELLGDGSGGFTEATHSPFTAGSWPFAIDTGDFNGDGNLDIVTANRFAGNAGDDMSVLIGDGAGGFAAPLSVHSNSSGGAPTAVAIGDFNNDGKPDLVMNQAGLDRIVVGLNTTTVSTPAITDSSPTSPANDNSPKLIGTAEAGSTVKLYTSNDCTGSPVATDTAANFASPGIAVSVPDDTGNTFYATATNHAGWASACSAGFTYTEDSTAPVAPSGLTTNPASPGHSRTPEVSGTAEAGSTVKVYTSNDCSGSPAATGSASAFSSPGLSITVPRNATTSITATATDAAGNTSPCSSAISYVEAGTPVPTSLDFSPASPGRDTSPRMTGTAEAGSTVKLYTTSDCSGSPVATGTAADFASPGITVSVPSGTTRTFRATATDGDSNVSPCSDPVSYTQDNTGTSVYYVRSAGTGSACTQANPCGTIAAALDTHRLSPTTNDVIDVGAGTFVGVVDASNADDNGLTIRGSLGAGGSRQTTIRSDGSASCPVSGSCGVELGASPDVAITLKDANVDTVGNSTSVRPVGIAGGSDLMNVSVSSQPSGDPADIVRLGDDPGTTMDRSTIDASGTGATGIETGQAGFAITDSHVITGDNTYGIDHESGPSGKITLTRTWVEADPNDTGTYDIVSTGDVTLDSSLVTGGYEGLYFYSDGDGHQLQVQNSTIDVGQPGQSDNGNDAQDLYIDFSGAATPDNVTVASSILADDIQTYSGGAAGSFTCTHSDLQGVQLDAGITNDCAVGSTGNTTTDPANQFVGGSPFSWQLVAGAPAVDAGEPGAVDPAFSQTDLAGNPRLAPGTNATCPDGVVDMGAYERLGFPCNAPSIDSSSPGSPANNNSPKLIGTADAGTTVKLYKTNDCTGAPAATGSAATFSSPGIAVSVADDTTTTFKATATNATGTSPCSSGFTYTEDSTPPNTTITAGPTNGSFIKDATPTFHFSSSEAGSTFKCKVDSGAYASCTSPKTTATLSNGAHTFSVRATDPAGNADPTPASRQFTVDTHAPQTTLTSGPVSGTTRDRTPTFGFKSSEPGSTFACSLDHAAFKPCVSPHTTSSLSFANHTLDVRATDRAGNRDPTPAHAAFKVVH